jgi:hypothetical protein
MPVLRIEKCGCNCNEQSIHRQALEKRRAGGRLQSITQRTTRSEQTDRRCVSRPVTLQTVGAGVSFVETQISCDIHGIRVLIDNSKLRDSSFELRWGPKGSVSK